jgi:hypothetical protein
MFTAKCTATNYSATIVGCSGLSVCVSAGLGLEAHRRRAARRRTLRVEIAADGLAAHLFSVVKNETRMGERLGY